MFRRVVLSCIIAVFLLGCGSSDSSDTADVVIEEIETDTPVNEPETEDETEDEVTEDDVIEEIVLPTVPEKILLIKCGKTYGSIDLDCSNF